ncbi:MAG: MFS transporter [Clostridiaceae bacterium]
MDNEITSYRPLFQQREYLKLIAANVINRFGDSIDAIAFSWMMYEITQSAALMALILGLNYLPTILLQPFTGALVEHLSKKKVMVLFDIGRGIVVAAGVLFYVRGMLTPALLTAMTLVISTMEAFRSPAGAAIVPKLLAPELYKVGTALNQSASRVTELIGLAAAGGVVALIGVQGALLIDAATFFLSALIIAFIHIKEELDASRVNLRSTLSSFLEGFQLIRGNRVLLVLLLIGALMNFTFVPLNAFAVPFIADVLKGGAESLSIIQILFVAGMGLGSAIAPKIKRLSGRVQLVVFGLVSGAGLCLFSLGGYLSGDVLRFGTVFFACLLIGFAAGVVNVVFGTAFLKLVPADYMARMSGLSNAILVCSMPVGNFICSGLAAVMPVPFAILASGALCFLLYLSILRVKSLHAL